jgi:hypothetical protein
MPSSRRIYDTSHHLALRAKFCRKVSSDRDGTVSRRLGGLLRSYSGGFHGIAASPDMSEVYDDCVVQCDGWESRSRQCGRLTRSRERPRALLVALSARALHDVGLSTPEIDLSLELSQVSVPRTVHPMRPLSPPSVMSVVRSRSTSLTEVSTLWHRLVTKLAKTMNTAAFSYEA